MHSPLGTSIVTANAAYGNVTEELLLLLLCSLVPCSVQVSIQHLHPTAGGGGVKGCRQPAWRRLCSVSPPGTATRVRGRPPAGPFRPRL